MRLIKVIIERSIVLAFCFMCFLQVAAQENSPFSRYGIGDIYPNQNIATRGMGGVSAAYANEQALNTVNPASYSALRYVQLYGGARGALITYDIGISIDARTLRSTSQASTYKSTNFIPSYIQLGIPLGGKADLKNRNAGLVFGLRPSTRINYSVENIERTSIDSLKTLYEGNGGLNQVFVGLAKRWNNLSIGINGGYEFGKKDISTKIIFINDTVNYYKSNSENKTTFWGLFFTPGISYNMKLKEVKNVKGNYNEALFLRLGASATFSHSLKASTDTLRETFAYSDNTGTTPIDTIHFTAGERGNVNLPLTYNAGFMFSKKYIASNASVNKWSFGADYTAGQWSDYRFYGKQDQLLNSWMVHAGGEFIPSVFSTKFWSRSTYRIGFYAGKDYINADGNGYNMRALTLGFGFNVKRWTSYDNQSTLINTAIEFGKRGSNVNNVTESFFKLSVGLSLADLWFIRRKYD